METILINCAIICVAILFIEIIYFKYIEDDKKIRYEVLHTWCDGEILITANAGYTNFVSALSTYLKYKLFSNEKVVIKRYSEENK